MFPCAGDTTFQFTTALQTHFAAEDIAQYPTLVKTVGLRGEGALRMLRHFSHAAGASIASFIACARRLLS